MRKSLKKLKGTLNYNNYGGAAFLGVKKLVVKGHGASNSLAFLKCIEQVRTLHTKNYCEEVESELGGKVKFAKINTDENIEAAKQYQVSGLPTLLVFKDGQVVERMVGLMPKSSIITNIEKYL